MSILVEKISHNTSGGGSGNYPPANVYNVTLTPDTNSISITWSDPDDTIINTSTISTWYYTRLVRKEGSYPTSPNDGTIVIDNYERNKYSSTGYKDTGLNPETTYCYRFFTYSVDEVCNNSGNMIYEATTSKPVDPVFSNNSWELINEIAESGKASDYWSVGDEITVTLSDSDYFDFLYDTTITLQIWGFNHFDKSDGSGKAGIVLGCKDTIGSGYMRSNWSNDGGYGDSDVRLYFLDEIYINLPQQVKSIVKEVNIRTDIGYQGNYLDNTETISDKVFIPSLREVGLSASNDRITGVRRLSIFSNANSRKKREEWWTRSSVFLNSNDYYIVNERGSFTQSSAGDSNGILFCFNI